MFLHVSVIHSVHGGGVRGCSGGGHAWLLRGGMRGCSGGMRGCSWGECMVSLGGHAWLLLGGVWLLPGGMHGCSGVCGFSGGACVVAPGGHVWDTTRYADMVNERAVHILLECILVLQASVILSMVGDGVGLASQHASQVI